MAQKSTVEKKPVKKYTPITGCTKEPMEICAPSGYGFKEGEEESYDQTQTVVKDAPKEHCSLEPQRNCPSLFKVQDQPTKGQEASCKEMVLCTFRGIWSGLIEVTPIILLSFTEPTQVNQTNSPLHCFENNIVNIPFINIIKSLKILSFILISLGEISVVK